MRNTDILKHEIFKQEIFKKVILLTSIMAIFFFQFGCNKGETESPKLYKVMEVIDGDTYRLNNGEKVRLIGVNTPEISHPNKRAEFYGLEAYRYIKPKLLNQEVRLEFDVAKRDKYQRLLAYLYLKDGTFVNALLVKEGYARVMTVPPNVAYAISFFTLEKQARINNLGLWKRENQGNGAPENSQLPIKGNINQRGEKIYHLPGGRYYKQTKAEEYFSSEAEARKAGYRRAKD